MTRQWIKGHGHYAATISSGLAGRVEERLVASMHTIKIANGQYGVWHTRTLAESGHGALSGMILDLFANPEVS